MKTIQCWKLETISGAEGEHLSLTARFVSEREAELAKPACGGYGGQVRREIITIYDTAIEFNPQLNTKAARSGLAKLTEEERQALGITSVQ